MQVCTKTQRAGSEGFAGIGAKGRQNQAEVTTWHNAIHKMRTDMEMHGKTGERADVQMPIADEGCSKIGESELGKEVLRTRQESHAI